MAIRQVVCADLSAIRQIVGEAFGRPNEVSLIEELRANGDSIIEAVAVNRGSVAGHVMLSAMSAPFPALGLGPLAVAASHRRQGVASALVRWALEEADRGDWRAVFVLGDPHFYQRFGFDAKIASGFASPYAGPHLMALPLKGALPATSGKIDYASAFAKLG